MMAFGSVCQNTHLFSCASCRSIQEFDLCALLHLKFVKKHLWCSFSHSKTEYRIAPRVFCCSFLLQFLCIWTKRASTYNTVEDITTALASSEVYDAQMECKGGLFNQAAKHHSRSRIAGFIIYM